MSNSPHAPASGRHASSAPPTAVHSLQPSSPHLAAVAAIASLPALAAYLLRNVLPLPAEIALVHVAGTGLLVALAASEPLAAHTTWLLGKARERGGMAACCA